MDAEQHTHSDIERFGEDPPVQRVIAFHPEPGHDIEIRGKRGQQPQIVDVELAVRVHEHDEVATRGVKS